MAVNMRYGDDTTGAVYGQIAGAYYCEKESLQLEEIN